ncbi:preprotein translocase subunit SecG [Flavicella sediminum]|uniref:preprotein translocase subunit SecG n=1 Tax=Flavicella sediminum TaxID=2585141 RepID=UPI0011223014|nr:preprotein translocase subunit SecG [Flavicella sediminum]
MTYTLFLSLILIVAVLLILLIMVQNPKGGGLSSSFGGGGSQSMGGVQSTNNFLDKGTWTLAITLMALILLSNFAIPREGNSENSQIENRINDREISDEAPAQLPQLKEEATEEAAE